MDIWNRQIRTYFSELKYYTYNQIKESATTRGLYGLMTIVFKYKSLQQSNFKDKDDKANNEFGKVPINA